MAKDLVYFEEHNDFEVAKERELQIKGWSQEKKRRILIDSFNL